MQANTGSTTKTLRRDDVIKLLREHESELRKLGVRSLALFGSVVRDEARQDSDVDLMVEYEDGVTLFGCGRIASYLEQLLGANVDLSEKNMIYEELRPRIYREAVNVFTSTLLESSGEIGQAPAIASRPLEQGLQPSGRGARQLQEVEVKDAKVPLRHEIVKLLQSHERELRRLGVVSLALFGSIVRDEARPDSDIDLLVELADGVGLFGFARLNRYLEELLGMKVDLVMRGAVIKELRNRIFREAVNVL